MGEDEDTNVIDIKPFLSGGAAIEMRKVRPWTFDEGRHLQVLLDEEAKTVTCKSRDTSLDPFW